MAEAAYRKTAHPLYGLQEAVTMLREEWPELYTVYVKLTGGAALSKAEKEWLTEAAKASGWSIEDFERDLAMIAQPPSRRTLWYWKLFKKYFSEAQELYNKDTRQAAEKLWGAITALVKFYAALKNVPVFHWSRAKIENFVSNNVGERLRGRFRLLLDTGSTLHEHFYEGHLDMDGFLDRYRRAVKLIDEIVSEIKPMVESRGLRLPEL